MELIDTHCHLQFPQYDLDRDEIIRRALDARIGMVCVGTDKDSSRQAIELSDRFEGVLASVGLHPNDNLNEIYEQGAYEELISHPKVVAVGEIGLDYYRTEGEQEKQTQRERFMEQLQLIKNSRKPVIVHCRNAYGDMYEILKETLASPGGQYVRGVVHSFTGTWDQAQKFLGLGLSLGLNGIITFTDQYNEIVKNIPMERLLLETDAPFLAPIPYRGRRNEPLYIIEVAKKIAEVRDMAYEEVANITKHNSILMFMDAKF
jgi:TatD DNase family protein